MGWPQLGIHLLLEHPGTPVVQGITRNRWKGKKAGASPSSLPLKLVTEFRRCFLQCGDQLMGRRRNSASLAIDDFLRVG